MLWKFNHCINEEFTAVKRFWKLSDCMCACKLKHLYMKVNRKFGIVYGVACIGTKLFDFSEDGEGSVSVFVKCLFSFERGSMCEWQDFMVRQKITTIFLHVYLPQDTSLRTGSEPPGLSLVPPIWLGRLDSNSEIVHGI